ncbi:response regulator receiver and ANTAR domain protein [Lentzea xinjiangensis]|uniref:Response regulator receiver and ANTAR domain protein n=1 Tax=Lentzea xinjiangensis TaxID=402600 RepID=A0A1H9JWL0_9PSEU|nr:GAF and ANTAR domain-containing protein [Lentzea xinjiangensis]SEQ91123.1 response regulator receiver and ANTAR domain protein [Lentzea xinjiangensis]
MADYERPGSVRSIDGDRPDPLARLDETTEALTALHNAVSGEEAIDDALQRVAETAVRAVPDADAVTVSVVNEDQPRTAAATERRLVDLDEKQYSSGRGPCLEAAKTLTAVRAVIGENRDRWPEFEAAAAVAGVCAYLSVPVVLPATDDAEARHIGSVNIYSYTAAAFDPFDEGLMTLFTTAASSSIINGQRWQHSRTQVKQLERALHSRAVIDQSKGVLMAVHACTADEAFTMLVDRSQRENRKLRDVAADLLASVRRT